MAAYAHMMSAVMRAFRLFAREKPNIFSLPIGYAPSTMTGTNEQFDFIGTLSLQKRYHNHAVRGFRKLYFVCSGLTTKRRYAHPGSYGYLLFFNSILGESDWELLCRYCIYQGEGKEARLDIQALCRGHQAVCNSYPAPGKAGRRDKHRQRESCHRRCQVDGRV